MLAAALLPLPSHEVLKQGDTLATAVATLAVALVILRLFFVSNLVSHTIIHMAAQGPADLEISLFTTINVELPNFIISVLTC